MEPSTLLPGDDSWESLRRSAARLVSGPNHVIDDFLFFTDLHFWEIVSNPLRLLGKRFIGNANVLMKRRHHFPMENARPIARHALSLGVKELVIGGDMTSTATPREFAMAREFLDELEREGLRIRAIPGNHDVYTFEAARRRRFEATMEPFVPEGGYPAIERLPGGTPLVLLSTVCPNVLSSAGRISRETVRRVEELIGELKGPVIVVGHYPILDDTPQYHLSSGRRLRGGEHLREALGRAGRDVLYLAGHVHRFSSNPDPDHDRLHHVTGPGLFNRWEPARREGGFLRLSVTGEQLRVHHHFLGSEWGTEEFALRFR